MMCSSRSRRSASSLAGSRSTAAPAIGAIVVGALLYFPIRRFIKPGIPDVDPFHEESTVVSTAI